LNKQAKFKVMLLADNFIFLILAFLIIKIPVHLFQIIIIGDFIFKFFILIILFIPYLIISWVSFNKLGCEKAADFVLGIFKLMGFTIANVAYYYGFILIYIIALTLFFFAPVIVVYKVPALGLNLKTALYFGWLIQLLFGVYGGKYLRSILEFLANRLNNILQEFRGKDSNPSNFHFVNKQNLRRLTYGFALATYVIINFQKFSTVGQLVGHNATILLFNTIWSSIKDVAQEVFLTFIIIDSLLNIKNSESGKKITKPETKTKQGRKR